MYPRAEVPEELIPGMYEFDSLANLDPEKDYVGISASWALEHSGALAIWNRRA